MEWIALAVSLLVSVAGAAAERRFVWLQLQSRWVWPVALVDGIAVVVADDLGPAVFGLYGHASNAPWPCRRQAHAMSWHWLEGKLRCRRRDAR